jgi:hypothetical protein
MNKQLLLILSFPIIFMIHDFEEIIGIKPWINKNADYLYQRFPKLAPKFVSHLQHSTTERFAVGVAIMFILVCTVTYVSIWSQFYQLWMGAFMFFSIHIIIHIIQWIAVKRYVPVIITSLLSIPYCAYGIMVIINSFDSLTIVLWAAITFVVATFMLLFIHKFIIK